MEPLSKEKLEEVKKFAESLGFTELIFDENKQAFFAVSLPSASISVSYKVKVGYGPLPDRKERGYVTIGWNSEADAEDDENEWSIAQTKDFIKFMGYAVEIAEKLKEA